MIAVLISADAEWRVVRDAFSAAERQPSPFGEWLTAGVSSEPGSDPVLFFQGGWGKIAAAASTQYVIDRWRPQLLINLGTCGGFDGAIARGTIVLAVRTVVYDIVEQMGDYDEAVAHYATDLDAWWPDPNFLPDADVCRTVLASADRDILPSDIPDLRARFSAVAADWESGAIAWVAQRNHVPCLILRGVTDLVGSAGSEAYGDLDAFVRATGTVMRRLLAGLPGWIRLATQRADIAPTENPIV
jgi:adenosylhomocysteine nucleosidase